VATTESVRTERDTSGPVGAGDDVGGANADADATGTEMTAATAAAIAPTRVDRWNTMHLHVGSSLCTTYVEAGDRGSRTGRGSSVPCVTAKSV
jgi:hypothetical protein